MKHEKSCGAAIIHDGYLLLEYQTNDHWSFPKGHVEPGETEVETALREVKEETGLDIIINDSIRYSFSYIIQDQNIDKEIVIFPAQLKNPSQSLIKQDSEISELHWIPCAKVEETFNREAYREAWRYIYAQLQNQQKRA